MQGIKPTVSQMLDKYSTTELQPQALWICMLFYLYELNLLCIKYLKGEVDQDIKYFSLKLFYI